MGGAETEADRYGPVPVVRIAFATTVPEVLGDDDVDRPLHEAAFALAEISSTTAYGRIPMVRLDRLRPRGDQVGVGRG